MKKAPKKTTAKQKKQQNTSFKKIEPFIIMALLIFIAAFYAVKMPLESSDLGRHIKNGEVALHDFSFFQKNYYSYTEPEFKTNTHHWGAGVFYYFVHNFTGFTGLHFLNILLYLLTAWLIFMAAKEASSFRFALFAMVLCIPLFTNRVEIRPEVFSYVFLALIIYLLILFEKGKIGRKPVLLSTLIFIPWVNMHIFFILGLMLIGIYFVAALIRKREHAKFYALVLGASMLFSMFSPYTYMALIEPFIIFREYGYMIAENQSVIFMQKRFPENPFYIYFQLIFGLAVLLQLYNNIVSKQLKDIPMLLILVVFSVLAWRMNRGVAPFGLMAVIIIAKSLFDFFENRKRARYANRIFIAVYVFLTLLLFVGKNPLFNPIRPNSGIGLADGSGLSAQFFTYTGIQGPIFNNYDIGSFLIYNFFPQERVFVDNRPEAYSIDFFKEIYIKMQEDETRWAELSEQYGINTIYFYRLDMTPWAQPFLIRRLDDPEWAPVYVDDFTIILLKRNEKNALIINTYELPKSMFFVV